MTGATMAAGPAGGPVPSIDRAALRRLVVALVAEQFGRARMRPLGPDEWAMWTDETAIDEAGVGADSLQRLEIIGRVNRFFELHRTGVEDYLLLRTSIGAWTELVRTSLGISFEAITFESGGTTDAPRSLRHPVRDLLDEVAAHLALFGPPRRILALVPPHHIYGFIFTVLLPSVAQAGVVDCRSWPPEAVPGKCMAGDLVVATPFLWERILAGTGRFPGGVTGVTSTSAARAGLWPDLAERRLARLVEIYGSSETGGIGWRDDGDKDFVTLGHLDAAAGMARRRDGRTLEMPDILDWTAPDRFRPVARRDHGVKIGGLLAYPARTAAHVGRHGCVRDCAVRADAALGRLKAYVVPSREGREIGRTRMETLLEAHCRDLPAHERPVHFTFGEALPRSAMGKLADWPVAVESG